MKEFRTEKAVVRVHTPVRTDEEESDCRKRVIAELRRISAGIPEKNDSDSSSGQS